MLKFDARPKNNNGVKRKYDPLDQNLAEDSFKVSDQIFRYD